MGTCDGEGVLTAMAGNQSLIDEARTWLGTPYHHQPRVKGVGVDCAMLTMHHWSGR